MERKKKEGERKRSIDERKEKAIRGRGVEGKGRVRLSQRKKAEQKVFFLFGRGREVAKKKKEKREKKREVVVDCGDHEQRRKKEGKEKKNRISRLPRPLSAQSSRSNRLARNPNAAINRSGQIVAQRGIDGALAGHRIGAFERGGSSRAVEKAQESSSLFFFLLVCAPKKKERKNEARASPFGCFCSLFASLRQQNAILFRKQPSVDSNWQ